MSINILWTISNSMGTISDLNMLKSIKDMNINIVTADREDRDSLGFLATGKKYILPKGDSPHYIERVKSICEKENISVIIPQYGDELIPLSQNLELFNSLGIKVLVSQDTSKLFIANNKKELFKYFLGADFIPAYKSACNLDDIERAVYGFNYPDNNICLKPALSEGSKGFFIITAENRDILKESSISNKISLEMLKSQLKHLEKLPELLIMEYLPGTEYSVDCVSKDGETIVCIPRERIETSMGVAVETITEKNEELIKITKRIVKELDLSYNTNIQFKYSYDGKPKLIDINPRVSGSLVANLGAGVNMLELSLKLVLGLPLPSIDIKWGTKMLRYWEQMFI